LIHIEKPPPDVTNPWSAVPKSSHRLLEKDDADNEYSIELVYVIYVNSEDEEWLNKKI